MVLEYLLSFFIFLLGLCIGSFLNCLIYRLETKKSLLGRSFCPHCRHQLVWKDLVPVFSFAVLQGKCRYCRKKISWQYPIVELFTGIIFLIIFSQMPNYNFLSLIFWLYISGTLIAILVYDFKHYIIPDKILFPAIGAALVYRILEAAFTGRWPMFSSYFFGALIASGFFFSIFLISAGKWMGFGDVKLAVLMGLLLGVKNVLVALFLSFFLGAIIGAAAMAWKKKSLKSEIPFGPFLVAGTFLAMFYGENLARWYFKFLI